mgnify:FL=1
MDITMQHVSFNTSAYHSQLSRQAIIHHAFNLFFFNLGLSTIASSSQVAVPNPFDMSLAQAPLFMLLVAALPMLGDRGMLKTRTLQFGLIAVYYLASVLLFAFNTQIGLAGVLLISLVGMASFLAPQKAALKQLTVFSLLAMTSALFLMTLTQH